MDVTEYRGADATVETGADGSVTVVFPDGLRLAVPVADRAEGSAHVGADGSFDEWRRLRMHVLWDAFRSGVPGLAEAVYSWSDGYGPRGFVPAQGYDWSGIRDSSDRAVEEMYRTALAWNVKVLAYAELLLASR